jgi:hypothetical protein
MKRFFTIFGLLTLIGWSGVSNAQNLIVSYPFSGNANDVSGNNLNGTVTNAVLSTDRYGNANSAYYFDGTSALITIPHNTILNAFPLTINVWFKTNTSGGGGGSIVNKYQNGSLNGYNLSLLASNGHYKTQYYYNGSNNVTGETTTTYNDNQWHMATAVYSNSDLKMYIDNSLVKTVSWTGTPQATTTTRDLLIGKLDEAVNYFYQGYIDDISLYNSALTLSQIDSLYIIIPNTNCLIASYPFNGNANDVSGNNLNGTVANAVISTDRFGNANSAYYFNGSTALITVPHNAILNTFPLSINVWFKTNTSGGGGGSIVNKYQNGSLNGYNLSLLASNGHYKTQYYYNGSNNVTGETTTTYNDNQWHMATAVYSSSDLKMYIDNVLVNTVNWTGTPQATTTTRDLLFGKLDDATNYYYQGYIDDISLYDCALSTIDIDSLFNITVTGINQNFPQNSISIYPNPTNSIINIDFGNEMSKTNYSIIMENTLGQVVFQTLTNQQNFQVDVNSFSRKGIYFVKIINNTSNAITTKKIILN